MEFLENAFKRLFSGCFLVYILLSSHAVNAANISTDLSPQAVVPNQLLIKFKPGVSAATKATISQQLGVIKRKSLLSISANQLSAKSVTTQALSTLSAWEKIEFSPGSDLSQLMALLSQNPAIDVAQPDYILHTYQTPNDPRFNELWGMSNIGAPLAWNVTTGSKNIIVAVIDTGVLYNHSDLADNMWKNPGEIANNNRDDDNNGYVDDIFGYDFENNDSDPIDDAGHGTHVAGTIGAVGNNNNGVAGVNWNTSIMALKFLGPNGGNTSAAISAIEYAVANGANIINASWGGSASNRALRDAITAANNAGVLFIAAAGNGSPSTCQGYDNDSSATPISYPASYTQTNIISVASIDDNRNNTISCFSNFGQLSVDLGAPGRGILSTWYDGTYKSLPGTSMATPHVAGAAALLWSAAPSLTHTEIKALLLNSTVANNSLNGITVTGGQLNVWNALQQIDDIPPAAINSLTSSAVSTNSVSLTWTAAGDDGNTGQVSAYDLRYSTTPLNANNFTTATPVSGVTATRPPGSLESFTVTNLSANTRYYFAIVALDNVGNQGPFSNVATATTNSINKAPIANPGGPYQGNPNSPVSFNGSASTDPEGQTLTYNWDFGDGTSGTGVRPRHTYTTTGNFTVRLTVNDTQINSLPVTTTATITVQVNLPPTINQLSATPQTILDTASSALRVTATDPENLALSYRWRVIPSNGGSFNNTTVAAPVFTPADVIGSQTVTLRVDVSDSVNTTTDSIQITVNDANPPSANLPPIISAISATPTSLFDTESSVLRVTASDPENAQLSYNWSVTPSINNNLVFDNPNIASPTFTPGDIDSNKTVTINVDVSDGANTVSRSIEITINDAGSLPTSRLLSENFQLDDLSAWRIVDVSSIPLFRKVRQTPSQWTTYAGALVQNSNIHSINTDISLPNKLGTYTVYKNGMSWTDYKFSVNIQSLDNDALGAIFRWQDDQNYYRVSWDKERSYRRLIKRQSGQFIILNEDSTTYELDTIYTFEVAVQNTAQNVATITINTWYTDNNGMKQPLPPISVTDSNPIPQGTIGLYSWLNSGSRFDDILVDELTQ